MGPLKPLIEEKFPWLFEELGFRPIAWSYNPKVLGDSTLTLESDTIRLRFTRDRGEIRADLASIHEPETWWNLVSLLEVIHGVKPEPQLEGVAPLVRTNYSQLVQALGPQLSETKKELERLAAESRQMMQEWQRSRNYERRRDLFNIGVAEVVRVSIRVSWALPSSCSLSGQ
jgi:HAMP domain-containing protein